MQDRNKIERQKQDRESLGQGKRPEKGKGKGWEVRDGRRELDLGGGQTQVQASNTRSICLAERSFEVAMALPIICRWGNWVPGMGGPYWGYLQWWYSYVYEAWFCAGNMTVIISMHPHYLTVITPLCRPVTCPGSPGCSWWQIWAQIVIGHTCESMLLTKTELKAPITLAECPPWKPPTERITGAAVYWVPTVCWTLCPLYVLTH